MTVDKKIKTKKKSVDVTNYFKELLFYNTYYKKSKMKCLKNMDLLSELPFYEELSAAKTNKDFRGHVMTYKVELIDQKDPLSQLTPNKSTIKDSFNELLDEIKGFKYQTTFQINSKKV